VLCVRGVGWRAGEVSILEDVTFEACRGEFIALTGRNGAGKSTLMDLVAGLRSPSAGDIMLDGRPLTRWTPLDRARVVSHLPQTVAARSVMTVSQLVMMGRYPHADRWFESSDDHRAAEDAMAACGCLEFRDREVATLSGGERQRVLLASCLAQEPKVLLLDEPAAFLDIDQQLHCFDLLRRQAATGVLCIAVTHDLNLALEFCTRLIVMAERTIARDVPMGEAAAHDDWLPYFSTRLERSVAADGRARISYR
jgi:iron complex transport system ATP-binding protein